MWWRGDVAVRSPSGGGHHPDRHATEDRSGRAGARFLGPLDPVDWHPRRVTVAGTSGTGKTTLSRSIGARLGLPMTEIDALFHGPGWQPRPSFVADVEAVVSGPEWAIEWQYRVVRERIADRADTLVWLDLPVRVTMWRVVRRTVVRRLRRTELWNGNTEPPLWTFLTDRDHIVRWAWAHRHILRGRIPEVATVRPDLHVIRLRSQREVDRWMAGLRP